MWEACGGRDSSVSIVTRYGQDGPGIESWWGGEIFRTRPDRPCGLPRLLYNGYRDFHGGKAAVALCWPPTPSTCRGHERVGLYLYSHSGPQWRVIRRTFTLILREACIKHSVVLCKNIWKRFFTDSTAVLIFKLVVHINKTTCFKDLWSSSGHPVSKK